MAPCQMDNNVIKARKQALERHSFFVKVELILWVELILFKINIENSKTNPMNIDLSVYFLALGWFFSTRRYKEEIYRKRE